jgi:predicted acyltransferase (DUF342 family)
MGILVIVAVVGAGLLSTSGASRIEAVRRHQSLQCFWLAESGLALGRAKLLNDAEYRNSPVPIVITNGLYAAYVTVVRSGNVYQVTSVGTSWVARFSRRVSQEFVIETLDYWDDFALMAGAGGIQMSQSVSIYGDVYSQGDLTMSQSAAIFETLYCEGNVTLSQSAAIYDQAFVGGTLSLRNSSVYGGSYPFSSPANPYYLNPPRVPEIDWTYYETLLAQCSLDEYQGLLAEAASSGLSSWPPSTNVINLAGQTVLVKGNKSLSGKKIISNPPGGKLIVSGSLSLSTTEIGQGLAIISGGDLTVSQLSVITGHVTLASVGNVSLQQSCKGGNEVVAIAGGNLYLSQSCQMGTRFIGIAGNNVDLGQSCQVASNATLVCGYLFSMGQSARIGANSVAYGGAEDRNEAVGCDGRAQCVDHAGGYRVATVRHRSRHGLCGHQPLYVPKRASPGTRVRWEPGGAFTERDDIV